jgi:hypothetical protein
MIIGLRWQSGVVIDINIPFAKIEAESVAAW